MAEINLLQNKVRDTTQVSSRRTVIVVWISSVLFVVLASAWGAMFYLTKKNTERHAELTAKNLEIQQQISSERSGVQNAQAYQAQLINIRQILDRHIMVSPVLIEMESYTYKSALYRNVSVFRETGRIHIEGMVGNYEDLGRLLLGLSTSDNFSNVTLLSVSASTGEDKSTGYVFSIDMDVNQSIF
jgi:hypothetical protein